MAAAHSVDADRVDQKEIAVLLDLKDGNAFIGDGIEVLAVSGNTEI